MRVAVESGVVKYRKNGTLLRTSTVAPTYPLYAGAALYTNGSTVTNAILNVGGSASAQLHWLITDHLGTPRMVLNESGALNKMTRHDYLPFGEELFVPTGGRTAAEGYVLGDGVRQQFTQKERDVEINLDYFGARSYSNAQARFVIPDPLLSSGIKANPQSWNRYSYCLNSPHTLVDPKGLIWETRTSVVDGVSTTEYKWIWQNEAEKGWEPVTNFHPDVMAPDGSIVGLHLNPNGPLTKAQLALRLVFGLSGWPSEYENHGYEFTANANDRNFRNRTGAVDMLQNQAFDVGMAASGLQIASLTKSVTFFRGSTTLDVLETVQNQAINVERIAARQSVATLDFGEGLYLTRSRQTAQIFADLQGLNGRQGGGAVMQATMSRFRFGQMQQSFNVIDRATISSMAGHSQTFVPQNAIPFLNRYAKFSFPE